MTPSTSIEEQGKHQDHLDQGLTAANRATDQT